MVKKAKSDLEKRRWFDRFALLEKLYEIKLVDDTPQTRADVIEAKLPSIDAEVAAKLKKIKNGGDDGIPDGQSASS
jgi:hypothetical protein